MLIDIEARFYRDGSARLVVVSPRGYGAIPAGSRGFDLKRDCLQVVKGLRAQGYKIHVPGE